MTGGAHLSIHNCSLAIALAVLLCAGPALGIVFHPGHEPAPDWSDKPADQLIGRWSYNGSFVVIAPNWIIGTRHQGTRPDTVRIGEIDYTTEYSNAWTGGPDATASSAGGMDFQLARLTAPDGSDANLTDFADIYTGNFFAGMELRLGGYGRGRGDDLQATGLDGGLITYGYQWGTRVNSELRWATNRANNVVSRNIDGTTTPLITADFDDPGAGNPTEYEGTVAEYDSGCGWFVRVGEQWQLLGLTRGVQAHGSPWPASGESWFRRSTAPDTLDPDEIDAIRVSQRELRNWIDSTIWRANNTNGDGHVTDADYTIWADNYGATNALWEMGDWNQDGSVTDADYTIWADNYEGGIPAGDLTFLMPPGGVPEPLTALTLAACLPLLQRRRGKRPKAAVSERR
jgi:hypothetical protein